MKNDFEIESYLGYQTTLDNISTEVKDDMVLCKESSSTRRLRIGILVIFGPITCGWLLFRLIVVPKFVGFLSVASLLFCMFLTVLLYRTIKDRRMIEFSERGISLRSRSKEILFIPRQDIQSLFVDHYKFEYRSNGVFCSSIQTLLRAKLNNNGTPRLAESSNDNQLRGLAEDLNKRFFSSRRV
jgi:hypothetical protein